MEYNHFYNIILYGAAGIIALKSASALYGHLHGRKMLRNLKKIRERVNLLEKISSEERRVT